MRITILTLLLTFATTVSAAEIVEQRTTLLGGVTAAVTVVANSGRPAATSAITAAFAKAKMTAEKITSDMSKINAQAATQAVSVSADTLKFLELARDVHAWTHGAFDITQSGGAGKIKVSNETVQLKKPGITLHTEGLLNGYLADVISDALVAGGMTNAMVQVGPVSRSTGQSAVGPWRVDVTDSKGGYAQRGLSLTFSDLAVATVGMGKAAPDQDPRNGKSFKPQMQGITILTSDGATAEALATAMFVLGPSGSASLAAELQNLKYVILDNTGTMVKSAGF